VLRIFSRRSNDVSYFTDDHALELEGLVEGPVGGCAATATRAVSATSPSPGDHEPFAGTRLRPHLRGAQGRLDPGRARSESAPGVLGAHRTSVAASMDYLEQRALVVRDRRMGVDRDDPGVGRASWDSPTGQSPRRAHVHDHVLVGARQKKRRRCLTLARSTSTRKQRTPCTDHRCVD